MISLNQIFLFQNDIQLDLPFIFFKYFLSETFHFLMGLISINDEQIENIPSKLFPLETFQLFNAFISDNDEQEPNISEKLFPFETFQFSNGFKSDKDEQL